MIHRNRHFAHRSRVDDGEEVTGDRIYERRLQRVWPTLGAAVKVARAFMENAGYYPGCVLEKYEVKDECIHLRYNCGTVVVDTRDAMGAPSVIDFITIEEEAERRRLTESVTKENKR